MNLQDSGRGNQTVGYRMSWTMKDFQEQKSPDVLIAGSFGGGDAAVAGAEDGFTRVTFPGGDNPKLEHYEQARLAGWAWRYGLLLYANANHYRKGERPEAGMKAGVPDMFLAEQRGGYGGLYIEMKRDGRQGEKNGGLSDAQVAIILRLREAGYYVAICYGYDEGRAAIERYRSGIVTRPITKG